MKKNLVIIHGWGKKESWSDVLSLLNDSNVLLLDLPGFDFALGKPYTFEDYLNYLEKNIHFEKFYLLGHSFGGALAVLYSLRHPEKIEKLILYNPAIIREGTIKTKISILLSKIFKPFEKILPKKLIFLLKKLYYKYIIRSYDYFLADENLKETFKNIRKDLRKEAEKLKVETILLWGRNDKITPLKQGKILNQIIKNSKLIVIDGGHSLHKENKENFVAKLKEIINE